MNQSNKIPSVSRRPLWKQIFLSEPEPRLRAGWRLAIQTLLLVLLAACTGGFLLVPYYLLNNEIPGGLTFLMFNAVIELVAFTLSIFLARRFLDKRSFVSLGLKPDGQAILDLLAGLVLAFVLMGSMYLAMTALGWVHFQGFAWQTQPPWTVFANGLLILLAFVLTGWNEELLSRGYHLQTITSGTNTAIGVIASSLVFGLLHLANQNASWVAVSGIFFAGLLFAFCYLRTGQLWLPIGLHIGWNFFEGPVFGFIVSGLDFYRLTNNSITGPELWTGGAFGPEAGLIVLPAIAVGVGLVYIYSTLRKRISPKI